MEAVVVEPDVAELRPHAVDPLYVQAAREALGRLERDHLKRRFESGSGTVRTTR